MDFEPVSLLIYGLPLLLAIPLHEAAHGWVAHKLGDDTAYSLGRVTANPFKHVDPMGTVILPLLLIITKAPFVFGWAKPVPVNFRALNRPRRDMVLVAAAGPGVNFLLAFISAVGLRLSEAGQFNVETAPWWVEMLVFSLMLNLALAIFNLIPLLPLDGGRILNGLLPPALAARHARTERFGMVLILVLFLAPPLLGSFFGRDWSLFAWILLPPVLEMAEFFLHLAGMA